MSTTDENGKVMDGRLQATMDAILQRLDKLEEDFVNLRDGNRPQWGNYIAAISTLLFVGTLAFAPVYGDIASLKDDRRLDRQFMFNIAKDGTRVGERLTGLEGKYDARVQEVNRRFIEDTDQRMTRMETRANERFNRLRIWIANLEKEVDQHYREVNAGE